MKNIRFLIFLLFPFFLFSQETEKRLALVIGNSNYDKGELKNPVNDARLIASTLDSLEFDVILKENLSTKRDMTAAIREFGAKRSEYDVAFVYYAGHGIQVDDENFLLPTKETFEEEFDVMDYGVSVRNIMRYLRAQTNQVNILILDACRDNPFESKWNTTRSLKSQGLAKIPPPTGSLIAFSTDSGQTAPDGDGENSVYTISLAKNMLLKDTSIDQVFRNVRAEVLAATEGMQRPVEATQLTGNTFYLNALSREFLIKSINQLFAEYKIDDAIKLSNDFIYRFPENAYGYVKLAQAYQINNQNKSSIKNYKKAIEIDPAIDEIYICIINNKETDEGSRLGLLPIYYNTNPETWENLFLKYYDLNTENPIANFVMGQLYYHYQPQKSKTYFERAIKFGKSVVFPHLTDELFFLNENNLNSKSRDYFKNLTKNWLIYSHTQLGNFQIGIRYANELEQETSSNYLKSTAISAKAEIYLKKNDTLNAIKFFEKAIEISSEPTTLNYLSDLYESRALRTGSIDDLNKAFSYINQSIYQFEEISRGRALAYVRRSNLYQNYTKNIVAVISDLNKAINISYKLFEQPFLHTFLRRLQIYNDNKMYDYMCNDLIELKRLINNKIFTKQELEVLERYLLENLDIKLNLLLEEFELQNCLSTFEYYSETFTSEK